MSKEDMGAMQPIVDITNEALKSRIENTVVLDKPYKFEGTEYTEIDMSGLHKLTIQDAIDTQRELFGQQEVASSLLCETTTAFAMAIAAKATGLPVEFFKMMPRPAGRKVKRMVQDHIRAEGEEGKARNVFWLKKPYVFREEQYEFFDLSNAGSMTMLQESAAENIMAREGFVITENTFNYLYACVVASMAVDKPKELFTGLPLCELLGLKEAVNSADFFE